KAAFFGCAAAVTCIGMATGLYHLNDEELFFAIAGIIVSGVGMLAVWFIPVPEPEFLRNAQPVSSQSAVESQRREEKARKLKLAGLGLWGVAIVLIPILLVTVNENDWDEVFPATMVPLGVLGLVLGVSGFAYAMKKKSE